LAGDLARGWAGRRCAARCCTARSNRQLIPILAVTQQGLRAGALPYLCNPGT